MAHGGEGKTVDIQGVAKRAVVACRKIVASAEGEEFGGTEGIVIKVEKRMG
jgi:hypothetical protein